MTELLGDFFIHKNISILPLYSFLENRFMLNGMIFDDLSDFCVRKRLCYHLRNL